MKSLALFAGSILILSGCASKPHPATAEAKPPKREAAVTRPKSQYAIEDFMDTVRIMGSSFSADETSILVSSDETGIFNAYTVSIRTGERVPLTRSTNDSTFAVDYFPTD